MKRFCGFIFTAAILLSLAGCGGSEAGTSNSGTPEKVSSTTGAGGEQTEAAPTTSVAQSQPEESGEETTTERTTAETARSASAEEDPPENVYAETMGDKVRPELSDIPKRVYVPNTGSGTVDVIDPETYQVVDSYAVGSIPHHVTPSYDMSKLYVNNEDSQSLTVIDPKTGKPSGEIQVPYPYNLYFTPDGEKAIVVVERIQTVEFRDRESWELLGSVHVPSPGVDHMDFSADGDYLLASTEWGGHIVKIDVNKMELTESIHVGGAPVDIKLSPDGSVFYVANQGEGYGGVHVIDPEKMQEIEFIPTGAGAHGLYPSKDTESLYVANRLEGSISVIDFGSREVTDKWVVGGSPDMLQLSPDGSEMWYADRYHNTVSVVSTETGELLHRIPVGGEPHGMTYFPNVGRYSLGHNGVYR